MPPFLILCLTNFMMAIGHGMVSPVLPIYAKSFGVSVTEVGFIMTSYALARVFFDLPAGFSSQRFGMARVLSAALMITVVSVLMLGLVRSFWVFIFWRFCQGVGSALFTAPALAGVADQSPPERIARNIAIFQGFHHLGTSCGPTVGGWVAEALGYRAPFFFFAGAMIIGAVLVIISLRSWPRPHFQRAQGEGRSEKGLSNMEEPPASVRLKDRQEIHPGALKSMVGVFTNWQFVLIAAVEFVIFFARAGGQLTIVPLLGSGELGLKVSQVGTALTLTSAGQLCTMYAAGWLGDRFGVKKVLVPSIMIAGLSYFFFSISRDYSTYLGSAVLLGIGKGFGGPLPVAYAAQIRGAASFSVVMGALRFSGDVGLVIGPLVLGLASDMAGYREALMINGLMLVGIMVVFALLASKSAPAHTKTGVS
jgi:DHA1 family multidrug resistance protein-like MFS transporter